MQHRGGVQDAEGLATGNNGPSSLKNHLWGILLPHNPRGRCGCFFFSLPMWASGHGLVFVVCLFVLIYFYIY